YATGFIGYFYILTFTIGFGAAVLVGQEIILSIDQGGNMAAPLLAEALGGSIFLGFLAAVAFATILAVVAGLTLTAAFALSHDLDVVVYPNNVAAEKEDVMVAKTSTLVLGILAIVLGIVFKNQNVAFIVGLAFAVAASANFPSLLLSIIWRGFTTAGAVVSSLTGLFLATALIILSPTVWVDILNNPEPIFPLGNPALVSMTAAFAVGIIISLLTRERQAEARFDEEKLRTYVGIGAE